MNATQPIDNPQFSQTEIAELRSQLKDYAPAIEALQSLEHHSGELNASIEAHMTEQFGGQLVFAEDGRSLWDVMKLVLRDELCGDEGFRGKLNEYLEKKEAPFLTGVIVYLATQVTLPFPVDPGLATLVVLYLVKVGLKVFCEYTKPEGG